ncbi:MAG TPA: Uma2 family endonuclease, partial [Blastocatellia bacterium]
MTDQEFFALCQSNETVLFERQAKGQIIERALAGWQTSQHSIEITRQLGNWSKQNNLGVGFGALTGFALPNGAIRGAYAAWVLRSRMADLTAEQKKGFLPISPDFVAELISEPTDLPYFQRKMEEYVSCGSRLGWLIDPDEKTVYVYRPGAAVQKLENV